MLDIWKRDLSKQGVPRYKSNGTQFVYNDFGRGARTAACHSVRKRKGWEACTACRMNEYGASVDRHKSLTNKVNVEIVNMKYLRVECGGQAWPYSLGWENIFVCRLCKEALYFSWIYRSDLAIVRVASTMLTKNGFDGQSVALWLIDIANGPKLTF